MSDHWKTQPRAPAGNEDGGQWTNHGQAPGTKAQGQDGQAHDGDVPAYGEPREAAADELDAFHYSGEPRAALSSEFYGTGYPGAERDRLNLPGVDPRLRQRLYFYVNEGKGIRPESGVGAHAHRLKLRNVYDYRKDGGALWRGIGDMNARELAVIEAGYDGYYAPAFGVNQGVAVLLGRHFTPALHVGRRNDAVEYKPPVLTKNPAHYVRFPYGRSP